MPKLDASEPDRDKSSDEAATMTDEGADESLADQSLADQSPDDVIASLRQEVDQVKDQLLRTQAELENFRKRSRRELDDQRRYAGLPIMRDMIKVVENMRLATESAERTQDTAGLLAGVKMVADQFVSVLAQHDCKPIESLGAVFDPNIHEAIGQEPTDAQPPYTIAREARAGYMLYDRVVRPSQVFIAVPAPPAGDAEAATAENAG